MNSSCNLQRFEDRILCPICLEVLCSPVTTACGHNFCMACLQGYWDHQAALGEATCCPQCREPFSARPCLRKNITLGEIVACLTSGQASVGHRQAGTGLGDIPCDACSPRKLRSVKSCLRCAASLCETHLRAHNKERGSRGHRLPQPLRDRQAPACPKHLKPQRLYCRTDGCCLCQACLLDDHKNHDTVPLEEERTHKEVQVRKAQASLENQMLIIVSESQTHQSRVAVVLKLIQAMREEVSNCFAEIGGEMERLQARVLEFVEEEAAKALGQLGCSIQDSHRRLIELESDSLWLQTLSHTPSDQQFLEEFAQMKTVPACPGPLLGAACEESHSFPGLVEALARLRAQLAAVGLRFSNQALLAGVKMRTYEVLPAAVERKGLLKDYCNLHFDPATASEELFLFQETHSVLNLGMLVEEPRRAGPCRAFQQWPQVLCTPGLAQGRRFYWELHLSDSWICLGVTYGRGAPAAGPAQCACPARGPSPAHRPGSAHDPSSAHRQGPAQCACPAHGPSSAHLPGPAHDPSSAHRQGPSQCACPARGLSSAHRPGTAHLPGPAHDPSPAHLPSSTQCACPAPRRDLFHLIGRNSASWCLEWDSLKFSAWHDNAQTVLRGGYYRTLGVALDPAAGSLAFYGLGGGQVSLIYRFLTTFKEPLFPAVMVSSGASVTLRHYPK
ncbi:E3 ubiquitin-protein ligase TRIM47-like [Tachyglossus aculeatus]|uniref:E3 ubiquitin-protein ligase TRIM47-like n=1 Tax=Tachyglossus aculeatus TaxID=9261 RepID=UPI0018F3F27A|nr:E3 ubiquitin-protein ligase TRIM47-like [Tachyglossus aculeatus]XP_038597870.1 E3 ubiquitin-protein ligase TRIM47-like [Tachyglossus aculeatus]